MSPPHRDPLDRCHHPLVRDLAWLLSAPDLLAMPWPGRPSRAELGLDDDARLAAWLADLEADPGALERCVGDARRGRMGLYHESLWQFLLAASPATQLLAHNLRIQRGKVTLGELDLLYRRHDDPTPIHLEVAIKFYLGQPRGPGNPDDQTRWIGPGGADSLAIKREHLHRHQLRLLEAVEAREALRTLVGTDDAGAERRLDIRPRVAMSGVLFYPWHRKLPPPRETRGDHLYGRWLYWHDWPRLRDGLARGTRGAWLTKPHWLALPRHAELLPLGEIEARLAEHFRRTGAPLQAALHHRDDGWRRLFLVADDWPRQIPLPPWPR